MFFGMDKNKRKNGYNCRVTSNFPDFSRFSRTCMNPECKEKTDHLGNSFQYAQCFEFVGSFSNIILPSIKIPRKIHKDTCNLDQSKFSTN